MEELTKQKLLKNVKHNDREEQQLLLQYIPEEDKKNIEEARKYIQKDNGLIYTEKGCINRASLSKISRLKTMAHHIEAGNWESLLERQ